MPEVIITITRDTDGTWVYSYEIDGESSYDDGMLTVEDVTGLIEQHMNEWEDGGDE